MNHPDPERDPLERLAEEFTHRLRCGEQPSVEEWAASHPDLSEQIRATFPGLVMMEQLASREFSARQTTAGGTTALATLQVERIGDFRIVREVGRGGMGIVYEAVQESLGRRVALKVLPTPRRAGVSGLARFEREAAAAARLHHTNIVPVFAVGSEEDVCFYAMQFIDGEPLDRILQQTDPGRLRESDYARWVARVGLQVAQGLAYAHSRGTLHRDIKPANLLIDEQQTIWITDLGVAQLAEADDLTLPGDLVGTLRYMSPEQLNGQADARSDIYSLGLTLYEMLTLCPAFGESSRIRLLRQISEAEPASLPKSNPDAPLDLVTIVSKAMAREPDRRYPSASELAEDLGRFLRGEPILARRTTLAERAWRWCRRNRSLAALAGAAILAILVAGVVGWVGYLATGRALTKADAAADRAEQNLQTALEAFERVFDRVAGSDTSLIGIEDPELELFPAVVPSDRDAALLEDMLGFYERYARQNESGDRLRSETASAYRRAGEIERRMGRPDRAEQALRRSLGIYDALTRRTSDGGNYRVEQAAVCNELGLALRELGRFPESRTDGFARALELVDGNESPAAKFQALRAHLVLGRQLTPQRARYWQWGWWAQPDMKPKATPRAEEAERHLREALQLAEFLVGHSPGNPSFELALAESHANLAFLLLRLERIQEGLAHDRAAVDILEQRVQNKPADPLCRQKLAETLVLAVGYGRTPLSAEDKRSRLDKARQIAKQLIEERPDYPEYRVLLAKTQVRQAAVLGSIGDRKGANGLLDQSITLLEDLAERYPGSPQFAFLLATTLIATSGATGSAEELESSRGQLERAIPILEKLSKEYPTAARWAKPYLERAEQRLRRAKQLRNREQAGTRVNPTSELFNLAER